MSRRTSARRRCRRASKSRSSSPANPKGPLATSGCHTTGLDPMLPRSAKKTPQIGTIDQSATAGRSDSDGGSENASPGPPWDAISASRRIARRTNTSIPIEKARHNTLIGRWASLGPHPQTLIRIPGNAAAVLVEPRLPVPAFRLAATIRPTASMLRRARRAAWRTSDACAGRP